MSVRTLVLAALVALCPACSGNGHVTPVPFVAKTGDTTVHCNCNLSFNNSQCSGGTCAAHFDITMCLPPRLNVDLYKPGIDGGVAPGKLTPAEFKTAVDDYCKNDVTNIVYHMIKVFNGGWCDYKAPYAPEGGIGTSVQCFAYPRDNGNGQATGPDTTTCNRPCPTTVCDYSSNCGAGVQDTFGNVHIEKCQCNQVTYYGCPGDPPGGLPTPVFCRPTE